MCIYAPIPSGKYIIFFTRFLSYFGLYVKSRRPGSKRTTLRTLSQIDLGYATAADRSGCKTVEFQKNVDDRIAAGIAMSGSATIECANMTHLTCTCNSIYRVAQKSKPLPIFQKKNRIRLLTRLDFFVKLKYEPSIIIQFVGNKYSVRNLLL